MQINIFGDNDFQYQYQIRGVGFLKKVLFILVALVVITLSACSNDKKEPVEEAKVYTDDLGVEVTIPANPERVVVATWHYPGHLLSLGITPVGVFELAQDSEFIGEQLKDATLLTQESVEETLALNPDLIITDSTNPNIDKLREIAPTVAFDLTKRQDRLATLVDIGEIVGKKEEAEKQIQEWNDKLNKAKERFDSEFNKEQTISVIGDYVTEFYIYGENYGRGTEILFSYLGLSYPEKLAEEIKKTGNRYVALSQEVIAEYVGDYVFIAGSNPGGTTILDDPLFADTAPVKEQRVNYIYEPSFYFSDPISLTGQLEYLETVLLDGGK